MYIGLETQGAGSTGFKVQKSRSQRFLNETSDERVLGLGTASEFWIHARDGAQGSQP